MTEAREGRIPFRGYGTWYRVVGGHERDKPPVLAIHGGPGLPHESLTPLKALADGGRRVVFYDQLGCGNSDRPEELAAFDVEMFVEELAAVRRGLNLDRVYLLGHSWGGILAMEYAAAGPAGIVGLVLVGTPASREEVRARREEVYEELPPDAARAIRYHEARGEFDAPAYREAIRHFYSRNVCRMDPWPDWLRRAEERQSVEVNARMWTGPLSDYDARPLLPKIKVPTLVVAGRHDGMTAGQERVLHEGIAGSELAVFKESAHYPFAEEPERFADAMEKFFVRAERNRRP